MSVPHSDHSGTARQLAEAVEALEKIGEPTGGICVSAEMAQVMAKGVLNLIRATNTQPEGALRMTAVEIAVKALIDLANDKDIDPAVRCNAASNLLARNIDGALVFAGYDDQGQKAVA